VADLEVTSGKLMIGDPFLAGQPHRGILQWPNGRFAVEVFEMLDEYGEVSDLLGMRMSPAQSD
jgi:hypothetical protein